ncbi:HAD family hydrolase [SAR202 cluster bacterium AD-802-E10_MRT_200m]|nr:HAD family hydrolase [SAR202 cluster bacterium AD-802-E10_MRT_200m]
MSSIKAVVFDIYETLAFNGPNLWLNSFRKICESQNLFVEENILWERWISLERKFRLRRLDLETMELQRPFESYEQAWRSCFVQVFEEMHLQGDPIAATEICIRDLGMRPIYPDVLSTLEYIQAKCKIGALSNADSSFFYPFLRFHGIEGKFSALQCSEDVQAYKPHPSIFKKILESLSVLPGEAIQIGDTLNEDVLGAQLIGMKAVWVNRSGRARDVNLPVPDFEIKELNELGGILNNLREAHE